MQLHIARLCLDCNEVHDLSSCPICGSETFAYLTKWIPASERREPPPRPASSPTAEVYRDLLEPETTHERRSRRLLSTGVFGVAALATAAGWWWQRRTRGGGDGDGAGEKGAE